jgi:hypothetical protein
MQVRLWCYCGIGKVPSLMRTPSARLLFVHADSSIQTAKPYGGIQKSIRL